MKTYLSLFLIIRMMLSKIKIEIFYDSLCERCPFFFGMNLNGFLKHKNSLDEFDVDLNPFAEGSYYKYETNTLYSCPRGPEECKLNILHSCILNKFEEKKSALKIISCMNFLRFKNKKFPLDKLFTSCEKILKFDAKNVKSCLEDKEEGHNLLLPFAEKASNLRANNYPLIQIDEEPLDLT